MSRWNRAPQAVARIGGCVLLASVGNVLLAPVSTAGPAPAASLPAGAQLWAARYNNGIDTASAISVSPDSRRVFVTGTTAPFADRRSIVTISYNAANGAKRWTALYVPAGHYNASASSISVSPDGSRVFVTGTSTWIRNGQRGSDLATVAYNAGTGQRLWRTVYSPGRGYANARALAVSRDGKTVFIAGAAPGGRSGLDYVTVAYNAASGARRWIARYTGPGQRPDEPVALTVGPNGSRLFVTGTSKGATTGSDYATVAYNATTGARLWVRRYDGSAHGADIARGMTIGPAGGKIFVTGQSARTTGTAYATVAYNAVTGARLWVQRRQGTAYAIAVNRTGGLVFVTGQVSVSSWVHPYGTVAYRATTGQPVWTTRFTPPTNTMGYAFGIGTSIGVGPSGSTVYVTGPSNLDYGTVAYRAASGAQLWAASYSAPLREGADQRNRPAGIAVAPDGRAVIVTGTSLGAGTEEDLATVAHSTGT